MFENDTPNPLLRAWVDRDLCAGTGLCERECPEIFEVRDGWAEVLVAVVQAEHEAAVREAAAICPTEAIKLGGD